MNKDSNSYTKRLESDCDDLLFSSGKIIISWTQKDQNPKEQLRTCHIDFDLQFRSTAVLRLGEVEELIKNLETVRDRLK
jgi:hypothetical protein